MPMSGVTVCLVHKGCCALFQGSKALPPARFIFPQVSPSVQQSFLFHSSLLVARVPSRLPPPFFCPIQLCGGVLALLEGWSLLPAFNKCSVGTVPLVYLLYLYSGRKWAPCSTPQQSSTYINSKCIHSSVYVALTILKRLNDSSLPTFPAKLCLVLPFQFCLLYSVFQTPNCNDNFISFIPLHPQPGLYPFVFSFLQFFHFQLLCLQY